MGGSSVDDDWEITSSCNEVRTMVLVGRTGNGKSATGNSILGRRTFKSELSSCGVTSTCEMHTIVRRDGQIVNIIDTPGLFDSSVEYESVVNEIVKCLDLAKDGIHAVLLVYSVRTRFSHEEVAALHSLQTLFGNKIVDYMLVVFTGGDELKENQTLENYLGLGLNCPKPLKEILTRCKNRYVLLDNKTNDERKQFEQVERLLSLVNKVISQNGGQPYTDELFTELKVDAMNGRSKIEILEFEEKMRRTDEELTKRITDTVESKLKESTAKLEQQLAEEQAARLKADGEMRKLREDLERAHEELRKRDGCAIL